MNPGPLTVMALASWVILPLVLIALGRGPLRIAGDRDRFLAAAGLTLGIWVLAGCLTWRLGAPSSWHDGLAGALILVTAVWAAGMVWSVVCWGLTTSLLTALEGLPGATGEEWIRAYAGSSGLEGFTRDRLSILTAMGLARESGGAVALTGLRPRLIAAGAQALQRLYGVRDG